jgi:S-adenosylmethionine decarboxylase
VADIFLLLLPDSIVTSMAQDTADDHHAPFEGPEKLLEIWFAPSASDVPDAEQASEEGRTGLRVVDRRTWEEMLDIVKCQVLSVIEGAEMDAYLLRLGYSKIIPYGYLCMNDLAVNHLSSLPPIALY